MDVKNCLKCKKELTKRQRYYCSNECKLTDPQGIKKRTPTKQKQDNSKLIKCKITGRTFKDMSNYSGVLTRHIQDLNLPTDDLFSHFEVIDNPDFGKPKYHCKYCDWTSKDISNVSGWITLHISKNHGIDIAEHLKNYPEEESIFEHTMKNIHRSKYFENIPDSSVICLECGEKHKKISSTHLKKHGLTPHQYKLKHGLNSTMSPMAVEKARQQYFENFDKINIYTKSSAPEQELVSFIESLGVTVKTGDRKILHPLEIDIFLPEYNIAIEYNGLIWHSEFFAKKNMRYHLNKTQKCEEKGIRMIHIFEDEWMYKRDIVKSKLKNILGKTEQKVYARNCEVKPIKYYIKNEFLEKYHIQGQDRSAVHLGVFHDSELVSVMTFSKPRILMGYKNTEEGMYELSRYASSISVVGGASKLLKYFITNYSPSKIITFADRRWTTLLGDSMYDKIGFIKTNVNRPNYWYIVNGRERKHRYTFNKAVIINKLGGDPNLTEVQNMINMGYDRIWDCGTIKYELNLK